MTRKKLQRLHRLAVQLLENHGVSYIRLAPLGGSRYQYHGCNTVNIDGRNGFTNFVRGAVEVG